MIISTLCTANAALMNSTRSMFRLESVINGFKWVRAGLPSSSKHTVPEAPIRRMKRKHEDEEENNVKRICTDIPSKDVNMVGCSTHYVLE